MRFGRVFLTIFNTKVARAAESWRRKLPVRGSPHGSARVSVRGQQRPRRGAGGAAPAERCAQAISYGTKLSTKCSPRLGNER